MKPDHQLVFGIVVAILGIPLLALLSRMLRIELEDGEVALVTRFGKLTATLRRPGWHWLLDRVAPWVKVIRVSTRRDFLEINEIGLNDARGTTVIVDVWMELRVVDPARASFDIEDWRGSMRNLVSHSVISILGNREFKEILADRSQLGELLRQDIIDETKRWGIELGPVFIKNVSLLPEIAQQLFQTVAARLERAKADLEEEGRQQVALLQADTSVRISKLVAKARGQYPEAIGRAYQSLAPQPEVLRAYQRLYELSLLKPDQTVAFHGFGENDLRPIDAAMLLPNTTAE